MHCSLHTKSNDYVDLEASTIPLLATLELIFKSMRVLIKTITVQTSAEKGNVNMPRCLKAPPLNLFAKSQLKSRLLKTSNITRQLDLTKAFVSSCFGAPPGRLTLI
jgi:hypothetical protein